jgi:hypothetical protein
MIVHMNPVWSAYGGTVPQVLNLGIRQILLSLQTTMVRWIVIVVNW